MQKLPSLDTVSIDMERKRITLDLDASLLLKLDDSAHHQKISRNRFILDSLTHAVGEIEKRRIDSQFAAMAGDPDYCNELLLIERELNSESARSWHQIYRREAT